MFKNHFKVEMEIFHYLNMLDISHVAFKPRFKYLLLLIPKHSLFKMCTLSIVRFLLWPLDCDM
jgi:hypothetical protein